MGDKTMTDKNDDSTNEAPAEQPTCSPPGGGRWTWANGEWVALPEPADKPNEATE